MFWCWCQARIDKQRYQEALSQYQQRLADQQAQEEEAAGPSGIAGAQPQAQPRLCDSAVTCLEQPDFMWACSNQHTSEVSQDLPFVMRQALPGLGSCKEQVLTVSCSCLPQSWSLAM